MTIENFKLKEFLKQDKKLIESYVVALQFMKPLKTKRQVFNMKLKDVEFIKKNLHSNSDEALIEVVKRVQKITKKEVLSLPIIEFFGIVASIKKQIETIASAEETSLAPSEVNLKWEAVNGSEIMSKFGIYNTLEQLSNGNALEYKDYMNMEYSEIFTILYMRKTASELSKRMDGIKLKTD